MICLSNYNSIPYRGTSVLLWFILLSKAMNPTSLSLATLHTKPSVNTCLATQFHFALPVGKNTNFNSCCSPISFFSSSILILILKGFLDLFLLGLNILPPEPKSVLKSQAIDLKSNLPVKIRISLPKSVLPD